MNAAHDQCPNDLCTGCPLELVFRERKTLLLGDTGIVSFSHSCPTCTFRHFQAFDWPFLILILTPALPMFLFILCQLTCFSCTAACATVRLFKVFVVLEEVPE